MCRFDREQRRGPLVAALILVILLSACGKANKAESPVASALAEAQTAAKQMKKYAFEMQLDQKLSGTAETAADIKVDMQGLVEREPLKLDQTINTTIDGETSVVRTVIVPEGYYMYLPEYEEWSKLTPANAAENTATLSDFQVDPGQAIQDIDTLAEFASVEKDARTQIVRYEGNGTEAKAYAVTLLKSTMGLSDMDQRTQDSLKVSKLKLTLTLDAANHWPMSYTIESELSLELETSKVTTVQMSLSGSYSEINKSTAVTLPEAAKGALDPDQIDEQLGDDPLNLKNGQ
ncbi:DUF6612 family protein [Cohnella yongneupensis]|uniref:DUF6612 family protein n=1 Tax=Cohnella yongneupensis TaxID=425006 RepID=A0ABW0R1I7_9BACL